MSALPFGKKLVLFLFPGLVIAGAWVGFPIAVQKYVKPGEPDRGLVNQSNEVTGETLFQQHCAYCHGPNGRGNGPAELTIKARSFGWDKFKFANTMNGVPTDDNLLAVLKRGIPGSAMPAFASLSGTELQLLVDHIRKLAHAGLYARIEDKQRKDDDFDPVQLHLQVAKLLTPGDLLPIPAFADATKESLANGKKVYLASCASCHGPEGKGDGPQEMKDDDGKPTRPRDLTRGVYKGGDTKADLYARIVLGVPGTPMPASTTLKPEEVQDVLNYVLALKSKSN